MHRSCYLPTPPSSLSVIVVPKRQLFGKYLELGEDAFGEWMTDEVGASHHSDIYIYGDNGLICAFSVIRARNYEVRDGGVFF